MKRKKSIIYLDRSQLEPHPDNPRKDLGDLTELRESIRQNGIMQNLTVIPTDDSLEHFRILIGHRRFAASEGILNELPCIMVEDLTDREQVGIMLCENLQRDDLTYYEQAQGFQMMMDLGDTVDQIADKTGFSTSTVRHRLEIAKLDKKVIDEVQKDTSWQIGINDYIELEKVKDIADRQEILEDSSDSDDLKNNVWRYLKEKKETANREKLTELLTGLGCKEVKEYMSYSDKYECFKLGKLGKEHKEFLYLDDDIDFDSLKETIEKKQKAKKDPVVYQMSYTVIYIGYKKVTADKEKKKTKEELERERKSQNEKALTDVRKQICGEFAKTIMDIDPDKFRHLEKEQNTFKPMLEKLWEIMEKAEVSFYYYGLKVEAMDTLDKAAMRPLSENYSEFHLIQKMMTRILIRLSSRHGGMSFCDYSNLPNTKNLEIFEQFYEILYYFGSRLGDDFEKILGGESDLYEKPKTKEE